MTKGAAVLMRERKSIRVGAVIAIGIAMMALVSCDRKSGDGGTAPAASSVPSTRSIDDLVKLLDGDDARARCDAAKELFAHGPSVAKELSTRGAKLATSEANPRRLDVVWTLASCSVPTSVRSDRLGIVFTPEVKESDVPGILKKHGLSLVEGTRYDASATPQVRVFAGYDAMLAKAHELMADEPKVLLVTFELVQ